jgi:hypothetical protein
VNGRAAAALAHERSLEAILARLGDRDADPASLEAAVARCTETFEALRSSGPATPDEDAALQRLRTRAAIALDQARRELDLVLRNLRQARNVRRAFAAQSTPDPRRSCDVEG